MRTINNSFLRNEAWKFILDNKIDRLPVNSLELARERSYVIHTYKEFSKIIDKPIVYIIEKYDFDGFVFWSEDDINYIIVYNDELSPAMQRWTIMHEISHIALEHITSDSPTLTRIRKTSHPYIEAEADGFTRRILCPSIVLYKCRAYDKKQILKLCGITITASGFREEYIHALLIRNKFLTHPLEIEVLEQFNKFITDYNQCNNSFIKTKKELYF